MSDKCRFCEKGFSKKSPFWTCPDGSKQHYEIYYCIVNLRLEVNRLKAEKQASEQSWKAALEVSKLPCGHPETFAVSTTPTASHGYCLKCHADKQQRRIEKLEKFISLYVNSVRCSCIQHQTLSGAWKDRECLKCRAGKLIGGAK